MTYATEQARLGREPFAIVEFVMDYCANTYGTLPCTASLSAGSECYNTRNELSDCQDTANYSKTTKTYKFCTPHPSLPHGLNAIPCIEGEPSFVPTQIRPDKGVSFESSVTITLRDLPHHDRGADPYVATRAEAQGLYFGRWLARNPFYRGRLMRVKTGYMGSTYSEADLQTRLYILEKVEGPIRKKDDIFYKITGVDMLGLANNDKTQIPVPSDGVLNAAITSSETGSFVLASGADLTKYPTGGGRVMIGDEALSYASRSGSTCSTLVRGLNGTTADSHDADDGVQIGRNFTGNPIAIIAEILKDDAGIDESYIPYDAGLDTPTGTNDAWDDEEDNWFSGISLDTWIFEPTGAFDLIDELCEIFLIDLWWDEVDAEINLKANVPPLGNAAVTQLSDTKNLIADRTKVKDLPNKRTSRVLVKFNKINVAEDNKNSNYANHHFETDADAESTDTYNEIKAKIIKSRWLNGTHIGVATQTAQRYLARFGTTPKEIQFSLDAKDGDLRTGHLCDVDTSLIQDVDGTNKVTRFQVTSHREVEQGHRVEYKGLVFYFTNRNMFIADNATPQYSSASDAQKQANGFIGPNSGVFTDGGSLYLII